MRSLGRFFKRQVKTKTGKFCFGVIAGVLTTHVAPAGVQEYIPAFVQMALGPESLVLAGMGMYLRDKEAKKETGELYD